MMRSTFRMLLTAVAMSALLVCCKKKTLSSAVRPPGTEDSVPVSGHSAYVQTPRHLLVNANVGGFYEALPPTYNTDPQKKFPLLLFLHGGGELGNGNEDLPLVLKNAIPKRLQSNDFPLSFSVSDSQFSFVVISPQFRAWPKPDDVEAVMDYAIDHYRVDTHRLYLVGLSMGGGATWEYAARHGKRLAAMVPISGASWADSATAKGIAATNVPTWAFHNRDDSVVTYRSTTRYISFIRYFNPAFPVRYTEWEKGGHDAWTRATDPMYREENKNIYEWMLQYVR